MLLSPTFDFMTNVEFLTTFKCSFIRLFVRTKYYTRNTSWKDFCQFICLCIPPYLFSFILYWLILKLQNSNKLGMTPSLIKKQVLGNARLHHKCWQPQLTRIPKRKCDWYFYFLYVLFSLYWVKVCLIYDWNSSYQVGLYVASSA